MPSRYKILRFRGTRRLRPWLRKAVAPFRWRVVILLYHRVFEASSDPWQLCVSPEHFAEQLEYLQQHYTVLSLSKLVESLRYGQLPKKAVVITFDDGYADNLWHAKPLLERYEIPATVFISSGYIDCPNEFWWDDLARILLEAKKLPTSVTLSLRGEKYGWSFTNPTDREASYIDIHQTLQPLPAGEREQALTKLFTWANVAPEGRANFRPLTKAELLELSQSDFVEIGDHTVTHPLLSSLSKAEQFVEVVNSRRQLEEILGRTVDTFSYPYGNLTPQTMDIVEAAGFEAALTLDQNPIEVGHNPFRMGRFGVGDWDAEMFGQYLNKCFRA